MPPSVVMFDFGNVLGFFDYDVIFGKLGARLGMTADAFRELVEAKGMKSILAEFEAGAIEPEEFSTRVQAAVGLDVPFADFVADWEDIFELNEPVAAVAADLKARGYTLVLGSNTNALHAAFYRHKFREALAAFDHVVLSYVVKAMKPGREFFRACVEAVGVPAGGCVFIDDVEENVQGARDAGLLGIVYRDPAGLVAELRRLGVEASAVDAGN
ncbi:HAD family phosphatase [Paludisphaera sp.]|uniref:HAD family hydrolase n=1 Tax=Paludisphaera sp. TaxID=2017432 RepID=UPI00301CD515